MRFRPQARGFVGGVLLCSGAGLLGGCPPRMDDAEPIGLVVVASGLTAPVALDQPNDNTNRLFIVDQVGLVRILQPNGQLSATPFLDVRSRIVSLTPGYDERGLLGLAFHPAYRENRRFYVAYNSPVVADSPPQALNSELRLVEYQASAADPNVADLSSERVLLRIGKPQANHNGGQVAFGPDGYLYFSVGDGGGANDTGAGHNPQIGNAQDLTSLLGKVLRLDVDDADPYVVPPDNPLVGRAGVRTEIWAYGLRNPWRFSFDRAGGNRLFLADAGQELFEEVDIIQKGGNYGWRVKEGAACFDPDSPRNPPESCPSQGASGEPLIDPIIELPHTVNGTPVGTVVIGGYVYRGSAVPKLAANYVFGDFSSLIAVPNGQLYAASQGSDGTWSRRALAVAGTPDGELGRYILAFGQDQAGEVYVLSSGSLGPTGTSGVVYRITAAE